MLHLMCHKFSADTDGKLDIFKSISHYLKIELMNLAGLNYGLRF